MNDAELLSEYVATGSPDCFAKLVRGHIDLVYASALRQTRDRHLADDITQVVFVVLARKAGSIRNPAMLSGWLIGTTRLAAKQAKRANMRRRFHEQRAAAMVQLEIETLPESNEENIRAVLDLALSRLSETDRCAIVLRYLRGLSISAVGIELGLSGNTAHKRIVRALTKLRKFMVRRGIANAGDAVESTLVAESTCVAPPLLASAVLERSPGANALIVANMTIKAMSLGKAVLIAVGASAAVVVLGAVTLIQTLKPVSAATPVTPLPVILTDASAVSTEPSGTAISLENVTFAFMSNVKGANKDFPVVLDPAVLRNGKTTLLLSSATRNWGTGGEAARTVNIQPLLGKRMRFSAYVKTEKLANWGGIQMWALGPGNKFMLHDDMGDRPIVGTTDWRKYEIVADVPADIQMMTVGLHLYGGGKIWMDGAQLDLVGPDVPVTDDAQFHAWSFSSPHYSHVLDASTQREGHPTVLLSSTKAKAGEWYAWDQNDRHPEQYRGKRLRMTAWIKTENVSTPSGLNLRILGDHINTIAPTVTMLIRGTNDWKQYELTADIPQETGCICSGFRLNGKGKLWLDDVRYQIVGN